MHFKKLKIKMNYRKLQFFGDKKGWIIGSKDRISDILHFFLMHQINGYLKLSLWVPFFNYCFENVIPAEME